jgi:predicted PurR-regulated permease PerM
MTNQRVGRSDSAVNVVWRLLMRLIVIALTLFACYRLRNIITTLFIAAIIAYVLDPVVEWLIHCRPFVLVHGAISQLAARIGANYQRIFYRRQVSMMGRAHIHRHVLRVYASLYVFIGFLIALWYGGKLIINPFVSEFSNAAKNRDAIVKSINEKLNAYDRVAPDGAKSQKIQEMLRKVDFAKTGQALAAEAGTKVLEGAKNIVEVVVLPVLAFYFLIDGRKLKHEFIALTPRSKLHETMRIVNEFNRIMRAFIVGQVILCVLAGVVVGVGLAALGVKYPMVMGVLAGLTRAIPIIGPIIGGIPIILLTLATKGVPTALGVLGFFTFLHFAESKFIMPLLIGDRMELHPVVIIVVLIAGGEIGGLLIGGSLGSLLGMFFAAPVASIVRVMVRRYWLNVRRTPSHWDQRAMGNGAYSAFGAAHTDSMPVRDGVNGSQIPEGAD